MKRLIALLCLGALVFTASDVGAQSFPYVTGKQLRWADYTAGTASAWRDTAYFSNADAPDTTEVLDMTQVALGWPGMDFAGTGIGMLRFVVTFKHNNADSVYLAVDGAFSPSGPWMGVGTSIGYLAGASGDAAASGNMLFDFDLNTGTTMPEVLSGFPYLRFRFRSDATGLPLSGTRFFVYYPRLTEETPKRIFQQLRWVNVAGEIPEGSNGCGQYYSVTYADTSSIYWPADTTSNTAAIDTTEAFDMSKITLLSPARGASGSPTPLVLGIAGTESGGNCDSILYLVDVAPTPIGPWREATTGEWGIRDNSGVNFAHITATNTTAVSADTRSAILNSPYIRVRIKTYGKQDAGGGGIRGARAYIGFYSADKP